MSTGHNFFDCGPNYLTAVDWNNPSHRRTVAASLVKGVSTMERDRQQNRQHFEALAPPWWKFFNFVKVDDLVDRHDDSYFGAVYELAMADIHKHSGRTPPRYVIAFRGSIIKLKTGGQDSRNNLLMAINNLQNTSRFHGGLETARQLVERAGPAGKVWLAGHSQGSALALLVGRKLVEQIGARLETYLFNPPFPSLPMEQLIPCTKIKRFSSLAKSVVTAALAVAQDREEDQFILLSKWTPYLFINTADLICSEFVAYFKHREYMESIGAGGIERLATQHSIRGMLLSAAGVQDCEAVHRIPSAHLIINHTHSKNPKKSHKIDQWWAKDSKFVDEYYHFD